MSTEETAIVKPQTAEASEADAVELTSSPVLVFGPAPARVAEAKTNAAKPFPWGGDFTGAASVGWEGPGGDKGLHPIGRAKMITLDGREARDISTAAGQGFTIDPNFMSYTTAPIKITALLRRNGDKGAGFGKSGGAGSSSRGLISNPSVSLLYTAKYPESPIGTGLRTWTKFPATFSHNRTK